MTYVRGELLDEWLLEVGLIVLNQGSVNTCVRSRLNSGHIVRKSRLGCRVRRWKVLVGEETLSDYRYIRFEVSSHLHTLSRPSRISFKDSSRWQLRSLDREILKEAAIVQS